MDFWPLAARASRSTSSADTAPPDLASTSKARSSGMPRISQRRIVSAVTSIASAAIFRLPKCSTNRFAIFISRSYTNFRLALQL